jgi:phosphatidylserine/phosphatidylglycerophosphate/cardiolipin synthase-like enzyme
MRTLPHSLLSVLLITLALAPGSVAAQQLCDTAFENCRTPLLNLIRNEQQGIDVAFWFMTDARYVRELELRRQAGVPVRVLVDRRANNSHPANASILAMLRDAGIPMRDKYAGDILHFKMMLFHGQNVVQFSKANYSDASFVPITPGANYFDEAIYLTNDDRLTNSFRRRFDDLWTNTSQYRTFANVSGPLVRNYPVYAIHPSMNFPPLQDFSNRSVSRYDREQQGIDAIVFRATDHRHVDAMIRAVARGTRVRLITEPSEYRNPVRLWHSKHVDRMYMGGVQIRHRQHEGLMHHASVVMHGLGEVIFGSSNWTTASAAYQDEHNFFYDPSLGKPWFFQWFADQFERKWNDTAGFADFQPLPPGPQVYLRPANGATGLSSSVTLRWDGGAWAHLYDIYFGTDPNPPLIASDRELGSPVDGRVEEFTVSNLLPGTTYYWRIVGKTWAQMARSGPTWSFTTEGDGPVTVSPGAASLASLRWKTDFTGAGRAAFASWEPATGTWGISDRSPSTGAITTFSRRWGAGALGDVPVPGDYDGDGRADIAVWRPQDGRWYILHSTTEYGAGPVVHWGSGAHRDVPVPGDYDGDGRTDVAVWRPSNGTWYVRFSSTGYTSGGVWQWGAGSLGDIPVPGDYDGDGKTDLAVWRPSTGTWFVRMSSTGFTQSLAVAWGSKALGDVPVAGDFDGDGRTDLAVWRPGTGEWFIRMSSTGFTQHFRLQWGAGQLGDVPLAHDFDGDGRSDITVWRPGTRTWYVRTSSTGFTGSFTLTWGTTTAVPIR